MSRASTSKWKLNVLLALVVCGVFANCLRNEFAWDDDEFVVRNIHLREVTYLGDILTNQVMAGSGLPSNFYRPTQGLTHFLDVQIWGDNALGHHLTNVLIHLLSASAVFWLLTTLFAPWPALFGALLFAIHPLQSEAVAYVSGRGDLLGMLFLCLGLLAFERRYVLSLLCAVLSLGSKESFVLFPAFLLLYQHMRGQKIDIRRHTPFWGLAALYVLARLTIFDFQDTLNFYGYADHPMADFAHRAFTYLTTLPGGLLLWLWPSDLHHERSWPLIEAANPEVWGALCGLALAGLIAWRTRVSHVGIAVGIVWFTIATTPTSNLVAVINTRFYDHWFLLPGLGLCFAATEVGNRFWAARAGRIGTCVVAISAGVTFAVMTPRHNAVWRDEIALNTHILEYEADSEKAGKIHHNLGKAYSEIRDYERARQEYQWVIDHGYQFAKTHYNLGVIHAVQGQYRLAREQLELALRLDSQFYPSLELLGRVSLLQGRLEEAAGFFDRALQIQPDYPEAFLGKARYFLRKDDPRGAMRELEKGLRRTPNHPGLQAEKQKLEAALGQPRR